MSSQYLITLGSERYINRVNYQFPMSTDVGQSYPGLLGAEFTLSQEDAERLTDTTVSGYSSSTKLGPGRYKIVKFASSLTITPARGLAVYWKAAQSPNEFIVTTDAPTGHSLFAGICLNAVTAGYYGIILVEGFTHIQCKASSITKSGAVGDVLKVVAAAGTWDNNATQPPITALTDSSGGTANNTVQAIGGTFSQSEIANNFADCAGKINELVAIVNGLVGPKVIAYEAPAADGLKKAYVTQNLPNLKPGNF